jgi:hypothetical protein
LVAAAHLRSKLYWQAVLTDRFGRSRRTSKARTMFTAPRRRFNQRLCAMHASLQGISLGHADILLQLRLPHHSKFHERFRTKYFVWVE